MKKLSFFLMAMLVSLTSFAAALGDGYSKVTDITTLSAGDKVVVYCDASSIGVTGSNGNKDATVAATGWVEYLVEAATNGVYLKDEAKNTYIASPGSSNQFKYGTKAVCTVDANGVLMCNNRFLCHNGQNGNYYRMYTSIGSYKPFYVYKVLAEGELKAPVINGEVEFETSTTVTIEVTEGLKAYYTLDGTEPTTASTEYTAPFEVTETTTVTAVAYDAAADQLSEVSTVTFKKLQVLTCAEAAALCTKTASADKYIIKGYVTSIAAAYDASYNNVSFWMADTEDGGKVIEPYRAIPTTAADKAVKVGDYVVVVGNLVLYGTTPEVNSGCKFTITEAPAPCKDATPVKWTETISLEANADKWYLVDIAEAVAAEKDLTLSITNTSDADVEVTIDSYSTCPADELDRILASTKTIKAGQTLEKDVNFVKYLQGLVDQVYLHVTTKGGAIEVKAETAKFNVTATAENGTVEGAGIYEQGAEATLTATAAEGYEFVNWTVDGVEVSTENPYKFTVTADVALVANFKAVVVEEPLPEGVPTNAELWEAFKPYYNTYYGLARADQPIDKVSTFAAAKMQEIMTDAASEYKWLGDYVLGVAAGQGVNLPTDMAAANEGAWRWAVHAFFNATTGANGAAGTDFTEAGKPQAWGPAYLAAQKPAEPVMETVYFVNALNWTGTINAYAWDPVQNAGWPGVAATKEAEQIAGYDVYSYTAEAGTYKNIIFNGTGGQTTDLVWTAGKYYVKDGWYTKEEAEAQLAKPVEYESVYFVNAQGWSKVNIYTWTPEVGGWPGVAMTKEAEQLAGYDVYSYTVEKGTSFGGMLFNNTTGAQTGDLKWTAGKYYVKDGWYTKEEAEAKLAAPVVVTWTMVGQEELFTPAWTPTAVENDMEKQEDGSYVLVLENKTLEAGTYEYKAVKNHDWAVSIPQEGNYTLEIAKDGDYTIEFTVNAAATELTAKVTYIEPAIEWIPMDLEIANLTTEVMEVEGAKYLLLQGRDDMNDADVMLFLNNYADVDDDYEVNTESSYMTFGGIELTVLEGVMTQTSETDKGTIYEGTVRTYAAEEDMYVEFALTMYAAPATELVITDATVEVNEDLGTLTFKTAEYFVELSGYTVPGVHEGPQICLLETPEAVAFANYVETSVADGVITLTGEFTSFMGAKFDVTISGKLPVEEPVVKPEPTYTENNLNTYAFGLESVLNDEALVVTYRLNNSNADEVQVVVLNGSEVVATVSGPKTIGKNTVEIPVADLPQGVQLTWKVVVKGTSVEAPTQEAKIYSFYHPSGLDIDNNPENPTFGMLLINEGMHSVKDKTEGYVSAQFGAGIFAFTPSLDLIPNGELPGYNGGIEFTTGRADAAGSTAYSPRRIRISEDGRIFVTSLNTDGNYLWEVNPANMNEWTSVFQGTLNDNKELVDAEGNFVAAPNNGFDVKGAGENLQLAMYSVNLPGITGAAMSGFRLHEYNLGTATEWATAPSKAIVEGKYAINYTGTQVEYDNEGGLWIASYRGTASDANPGLVHINAEGVEDAKLVWNNVRQAGIRFNNDFTKLVVAGNNGAAKKATIYAISKDANGAPVLTEETVIDMAVVGNNLNDFAFDYAGNLYACGNSSEKLVGWAMPYSGTVETPAAAKYAFQIGEPVEPVEMVGTVKRAVQNGSDVIVLTHEEDGTAHIYQVVNGVAIAELSQEGVIARDPENAGDLLAISDIAVTEDGKLVAINYMHTQAGDEYVNEGQKRGETRVYLWNDIAADPTLLFTSKMSSNWFRAKHGLTMAVKGTADNMEIFTTGIHATSAWARVSSFRVINGVYEEPAVNHNDHYYFYDIADAIALETTVGTQYELNASPLGAMNWVLDAELINPTEIVEPETNNVEIATAVALTEDLGKKYNGASYVTVGEKVLMVAPFANPDGQLVGVEILNITNGFDAPQYVNMVYVDEAVAATAAATAVEVVEGGLNITLVADATIHTWFVEMGEGTEYEVYEEEITNLVIDLDNLVLIGGPSANFQVDVYLPLGEYNMSEDSYQLTAESSIAVMGSDATFIDGYAYEVDAFTPSAKAVVHCEWNGMLLEFRLTMTAEPMEATVVVVENAVVEIEKYQIYGDMYDYALKMTGNWLNEEDGLTYPVLVEVPVYYPDATEPSEIMSTVTVGGWGDNDPWLGFGEGTLTVTTVNNVVTATGIVQNPMAGVAIDITISGSITNVPDGVENITVTAKPVKMIQNGQLIIKKGDAQYNAQGATLK